MHPLPPLLRVFLASAVATMPVAVAPGWSQEDDPSVQILPGQVSRAEDQRRDDPDSREEAPLEPQLVLPTGGLRAGAVPDDADTRFLTVSGREGQQVVLDEAALRRFALSGETLVTGSVPATGEGDRDLTTPIANTDEPVDAYAALGIRAGPLTWFPAIDLAVGYDSNIDSEANPDPVRTIRLSPELRVESDWVRHAFTGSVRGTIAFIDDGRDPEIGFTLDSALRLDLGLQTDVTLRGGYELSGESDSDPDALAGADGDTLTHELTAGIDVERPVGPVDVRVSLDVERDFYGASDLAGGGSQSNDDRNRTDGDLTLRVTQGEGPIIRPFVEASAGFRRFDEQVDRNGFERDSLGYGLRGGFTLSDDGPLFGEASVGVEGERFYDDQLDDVVALSVAASLTWDVSALTSVTLDVDTSLNPTTQAGSSVGVERSADLDVTHALRRNVDLRAGVGVEDTRFSGDGDDTRTYTGRAGVTWRLSPIVAFRVDTRFEHEPDGDDDINRFTAEAGITLRR